MKNAQAGLELMITLSILTILFIAFFIFYIEKNLQLHNSAAMLKLREDCMKISNAIEGVIYLGDGASYSLNTNSTIAVYQGAVIINNSQNSIGCTYRGDLANETFGNSINIINKNGAIAIYNV